MEEWEEWVWEAEVKAMPLLEELYISSCKLGCMPPGLMSHAMALKKLILWNVQRLHSLENFVSVVELELYNIPELSKISNLPKLQKLEIRYCPELETLQEIFLFEKGELPGLCIRTMHTALLLNNNKKGSKKVLKSSNNNKKSSHRAKKARRQTSQIKDATTGWQKERMVN
jgi:hypothetical protein